ncbi:MAG: hypothetical protein ACOH2A_08680 [Sphingobacteriaceae bacterium]
MGYLILERSTPTLSPGELQILRLATQVNSYFFGVVYVLDEPSAGLHPADTKALLRVLNKLKAAGNSLFVVEHEIDFIRHADWIVDLGPNARQYGREILYSGLPDGLRKITKSSTRKFVYEEEPKQQVKARKPQGWLKLENITRNNVKNLNVAFPIGVFTSITGISGSVKVHWLAKC